MTNRGKGRIVGIIGGLLLLGAFVALWLGNMIIALGFGIIGFFMIMISSTISTRSGSIRWLILAL